jgi:hypothetical protein
MRQVSYQIGLPRHSRRVSKAPTSVHTIVDKIDTPHSFRNLNYQVT